MNRLNKFGFILNKHEASFEAKFQLLKRSFMKKMDIVMYHAKMENKKIWFIMFDIA